MNTDGHRYGRTGGGKVFLSRDRSVAVHSRRTHDGPISRGCEQPRSAGTVAQNAVCVIRAFTLIELLVVIAIMGIVAALLVGMAGFSGDKKIRSRVKTELAGLETVIESYHAKNGFYPPNSGVGPGTNQLYYELTGTVPDGRDFKSKTGGEVIVAAVKGVFGIGGFLNSPDPETAVNFFPTMRPSLAKTITNGVPHKVLVVPVKGVNGDNAINTWNYITPGIHNPNSYDLWADVVIGSKTVQIGNWK